MKDFVLDLTYKDATIVNSNDDIFTISSNKLPYTSVTHHTINLNQGSSIHTKNHNKNDKFNIFNSIDCL
ncbi:hypothetical protein [Clostridium sp.]|uniref:hypothetical protein n=1 Tax=Clostridium sp. TaxID=1506 RepID=UPI0026167D5A|nr:hypothetical protein [Clostridium sp.]